MIISSMGIRMDMVPLGHQHPRAHKTTPSIFLSMPTLNKPTNYSEHLITSSTLSLLNGNITNCAFLANVIITPEWSSNICITSIEVVSWETTGMSKLPFSIKRNDTIFTYLGKTKRILTTYKHDCSKLFQGGVAKVNIPHVVSEGVWGYAPPGTL